MNTKLKRSSIGILKDRWKLIIGAFLLYFLILFGLTEIFNLALNQYNTGNEILLNWLPILFSLLLIPLYFGIFKYCMDFIEHKQKIRTLFEFYNTEDLFLKSIGAHLLQFLIIFIKSLFFVIPGIIAVFDYALVEYLIIKNPQIKIKDAINQSRKMMKGHKLELFSLQISFWGWYILSVLVSIFVMLIGMLISVHTGMSADLQAIIVGLSYIISLIITISLLLPYQMIATLKLFDNIYNSYNQIEIEEENSETVEDIQKTEILEKKIKKSVTNFVILIICSIVVLLYLIGSVEIDKQKNIEMFQEEMNGIIQSISTNTDIDMNIYCSDELGELEEYAKNTYSKLIKTSKEYIKSVNDLGFDRMLVASILDEDKPHMIKSKDKIYNLRKLTEEYSKNINTILDIKKMEMDISLIKMDQEEKDQYIELFRNDFNEYIDIYNDDNVWLIKLCDTYSNLINFLDTNNSKWHAVGEQMFLNDDIINEYNSLYNKIIEAGNNY